MRPLAWTLAALFLLGWTLAASPPQSPSPAMLSLTLLAMALELGAPTVSCLAGAAYVALAALSPPLAGVVGCGTLLLRTLLRGQARLVLPCLLPVLATAAAIVILRNWLSSPTWLALAGLEVYLPMALLLRGPGQRLAPVEAGAAFLAPVLVQLGWAGPLWLLPLFLVLLRASRQSLTEAAPDEVKLAEAAREKAEAGLELVRADQQRLGQQLIKKNEELGLLRQLARALAQQPDLEQMMELVLGNLQRLVTCRSVAFFEPDEEGLFPTYHRSPVPLQDARLLKLHEPLVEEAWRDQHVVSGIPGKLFEGERTAVAIPLEGMGVFYVGDQRQEPFTRDELQTLALTAAQAELALLSAERFQSQEQALTRHTRARHRLEEWLGGLGRLLQASQAVASTLDRASLAERLLTEVGGVVEHERFLLVMEQVNEGEDRPAWRQTAELVRENQRPLLLETTRGTRFADLEVESLLAVPLDTGALLLGHSQPGRFQRSQQELLLVLAVQVGAALANVRLHEQVVEAYRLLQQSQAQLIQSSKIAAVGQLAAGVAHELNTPLGAVVLALDSSLRDKELSERTQQRLTRARNAAMRAQEIVAKLLFYTREGRSEVRPVDLNVVVADTLEFLSYHLEQAKVQVDRQSAPVDLVLGNQHDLQQVLTNLILNARDALSTRAPSERWLGVSTRMDNGQAVVEIADRGVGMTPEVVERIFEPFFTTKEVGLGTGLGLSVSQQIVAQHQGKLEVASRPGEGTRFWLRLPAVSENHPA